MDNGRKGCRCGIRGAARCRPAICRGSFATDWARLADWATSGVSQSALRAERIGTTEIDQLNYLEESLVCLSQVNGPTIARSTSARPQAVLSVRIISNGANRTRAA